MPQDNDAVAFYDRIVQGKDDDDTITLEHSSGETLEGVEMKPVSKRVLASVIQRLPEQMFNAVEETDDYDEAEDELEEQGMSASAVTEATVAAFEDLCAESLTHPDLTSTQMEHIIEALGFEMLFSLGAEIIEISFEKSGDIKDFHAQQ
jgi:hypothetical protein